MSPASSVAAAAALTFAGPAAKPLRDPRRSDAYRGVDRPHRPPDGRADATGGGAVLTQVGARARWDRGPSALLVLGTRGDGHGRLWLRVRLPSRPNVTSGWIPAGLTQLSTTSYRVEVSVRPRLVRLLDRGRVIRRYDAVVGRPYWPTPHGLFAVSERVPQPDPHGILGPWALVLTAFSPTLTAFGGGPGQVALHGRGDSASPTRSGARAPTAVSDSRTSRSACSPESRVKERRSRSSRSRRRPERPRSRCNGRAGRLAELRERLPYKQRSLVRGQPAHSSAPIWNAGISGRRVDRSGTDVAGVRSEVRFHHVPKPLPAAEHESSIIRAAADRPDVLPSVVFYLDLAAELAADVDEDEPYNSPASMTAKKAAATVQNLASHANRGQDRELDSTVGRVRRAVEYADLHRLQERQQEATTTCWPST